MEAGEYIDWLRFDPPSHTDPSGRPPGSSPCSANLSRTCPGRYRASAPYAACVLAPPALDACVAAVAYEYPWPDLIVQFKFGGRPAWAASFAALLRSAPWVEPALENAQVVLPMPLSERRIRERGFNQALELARNLAPGKLRQGLLLRIRDTPPQSELKRLERLRNVRHVFAVEPLRAAELQGARVVLLDDVMTSGASIYSAAGALRAAGAVHITGMVLARADAPGGASDGE